MNPGYAKNKLTLQSVCYKLYTQVYLIYLFAYAGVES